VINLYDLEFCNGIVNMIPEGQVAEERLKNWTALKLKTFCHKKYQENKQLISKLGK
jgi:hypothetical protein